MYVLRLELPLDTRRWKRGMGMRTDTGTGQQEVQRKLQGDNWGGFLDKGSVGWWSTGHYAGMASVQEGLYWNILLIGYLALGYGWTREVPIFRRCVLQRCRLLRTGLRCQQFQEFRYAWQLERRVPDTSFAERSW